MVLEAGEVPVEVTLRGNIGDGVSAYAREKVQHALRATQGPVLRAHMVLDWSHDPAVEHRAVAEVSALVDGLGISATATAPTMVEAIDAAEAKLRRQLVHQRDRRRTRRRRP
jgi:ribosomal subunit interface protein